MKKSLVATLLVALLASSMVFAGFSGSASIGAGVNLDTKEYGFLNQGTNVKFNIDLTTASAEKQAEGDVYASIKASLSVFVLNDQKDGSAPADPITAPLNVVAKISEAKIAGKDWYVSILGVPSGLDFAKSPIDTWKVDAKDKYGVKQPKEEKKASFSIPYAKAPGVEVGLLGYTFGFGYKATGTNDDLFTKLQVSAFAKSPEYTVMEGLKVQAGVQYAADKVDADKTKNTNAFGGSVNVSFAKDPIKASIATDLGYNAVTEKFDADVLFNFGYDFLTVDAYYASNVTINSVATKNYISAKVKADLASFNLPLTVTATVKDIASEDKKQDISASVAYKGEGYTAEVGGGYNVGTEIWNVYGKGTLKISAFDVFAGVKVAKNTANEAKVGLMPYVGAKTEKLIPGATLTASWIGDDFGADVLAKKYGTIQATCKIAF